MRFLNRAFTIVVALCLCCSSVSAEYILNFKADTWDYATNGNAKAFADEQGRIRLNYLGASESLKGNSEVDTSHFNVGGKLFEIKFELSFNGLDNGCERSVLLRDGDEDVAFELLRADGEHITILGQYSLPAAAIEGESMKFVYTFNFAEEKCATVLYNDEKVFDGIIKYWNNELNIKDMYIRFRNYTVVGKKNSFSMIVNNVFASVYNAPPTLEIRGISDGEEFKKHELGNFLFKAEDDYGIEKIELYINGILKNTYTSLENVYDLSGLTYGTHNITISAYDIYGVKTDKTVNIIVTGNTEQVIFQENFENINLDGTESITTESGVKAIGQRGYYKTLKIDEEHGNSFSVGIDVANERETSSAWVGIPTSGMTEAFTFECDFFVSKKASDYTIRFKKNNSTEIYAITLNDYIQCGSVKNIPFEEAVWNKLKLVVDINNLCYSVYLNNSLVAEKITMPSIDVIDYVRFFGPTSDTVKTYLAVDNVVVTKNVKFPQFVGIDYHDNIIEARLSKDIYRNAFSKKNVSLVSEFGEEIKIVAAKCVGNTIQLELNDNLKTNTRYTFSLSSDTQVSKDVELGSEMSIVFRTACKGLEVRDVWFTTQNGANMAKINVINSEKERKNIYVVSAVWKGEMFVSSSAYKYEVGAEEEKNIDIMLSPISNGHTIELYIKDDLVQGKSLANRVYSIIGSVKLK